jgi:hypothetical protein
VTLAFNERKQLIHRVLLLDIRGDSLASGDRHADRKGLFGQVSKDGMGQINA